jgi:xanthine dehydrogenase accessory factor
VTSADVIAAAARLGSEGTPYALATVVNVVRPASTRRGDRALVTPDGRLTGWVGGACSEPVVVREALRALADGEARLVRIGPHDEGDDGPADVVVADSTCASEGTVEVLVEPQLPHPLVAVIGESPAARTLAELARAVGWRVSRDLEETPDAVVVATMGRGDEDALARALAGGAGYVGLVASARRAATVLDALRARGLDEEALVGVRSPAGLDLGPSRQEEIAVAILAELVAWSHDRATAPGALTEAVDPVCGMTVTIEAATEAADHDGVTYHFCCPGCRSRFQAAPARFLEAGAR